MAERGRKASTNVGLAAAAALLGALALVGGDTPAPGGAGAMSGLDLARALRDDPDGVVVFDVRDAAAFDEFHAPRALHVPASPAVLPDSAAARGAEPGTLIVVTGGEGVDPRRAWLALRRAGYERSHYVSDIVTAWLDDIVSPVLSPDAPPHVREAWEEQAELSRYFGGFPRIAVSTADVGEGTAARLRRAKRRGCAF